MKKRFHLPKENNTIEQYFQLPVMFLKASRWYVMCPWSNNNRGKNLQKIWEKDLGYTLDDEIWERILSQNGRHIREARGKFIQYKILNRYYYTPTRLNSMGLIQSRSCWKCKSECGTYIHALWECRMVFPLLNNVLALMED